MCYDVSKVITVTNNTHQQRNLKTNENSDHDNQRVHQKLKSLRIGERQEQQCGRETSNHSEKQFNPYEPVGKTAIDVTREGAADPHRKQVTTDDCRKLKHAIAQKVAGERARDELVDEPAGGNQQDRDEKRDPHGLVNGGRNDNADADGHCPD